MDQNCEYFSEEQMILSINGTKSEHKDAAREHLLYEKANNLGHEHEGKLEEPQKTHNESSYERLEPENDKVLHLNSQNHNNHNQVHATQEGNGRATSKYDHKETHSLAAKHIAAISEYRHSEETVPPNDAISNAEGMNLNENYKEIRPESLNKYTVHNKLQNGFIKEEGSDSFSDSNFEIEFEQSKANNTQDEENLEQPGSLADITPLKDIQERSNSLPEIPRGIRKIRANPVADSEIESSLEKKRNLSTTIDNLDLHDDFNKTCRTEIHLGSNRKSTERGCSSSLKKVQFKEQDHIEKISDDKLDSMTHDERFKEYELMIEKGLSLMGRNKFNQAAGIFECAADILNPLYFQNTPLLMPKVHQNLILGYNHAAACRLSTNRHADVCKNAKHVLNLDPQNMEAMYYYGVSKAKMGDANEAARMFLIAQSIKGKTKATESVQSACYHSFKKKIASHLKKLICENPDLDLEKIKELIALQTRKKFPSKRMLLVAMGGFVSATVAVYFVAKRFDMPQKRRITMSISSGILAGAISFLLNTIFNG